MVQDRGTMSKKSKIAELRAREEARTLTLNSNQIETLRVLFRATNIAQLQTEFQKNYGNQAAEDYVGRLIAMSKVIFN